MVFLEYLIFRTLKFVVRSNASNNVLNENEDVADIIQQYKASE